MRYIHTIEVIIEPVVVLLASRMSADLFRSLIATAQCVKERTFGVHAVSGSVVAAACVRNPVDDWAWCRGGGCGGGGGGR